MNPCDAVIEDGIAVEALIYLRCRLAQENSAVLVSCLSNGLVMGWPMDPHNGRCLGKFLAVSAETESFGAAAVSKDSEYLVTADSDGYVKVCYSYTITTSVRENV